MDLRPTPECCSCDFSLPQDPRAETAAVEETQGCTVDIPLPWSHFPLRALRASEAFTYLLFSLLWARSMTSIQQKS